MISQNAIMRLHKSESEKEDRSSVELVIIESFRYVVCISPDGQASTDPFISVILLKMKKPHINFGK